VSHFDGFCPMAAPRSARCRREGGTDHKQPSEGSAACDRSLPLSCSPAAGRRAANSHRR
jgi:hypothetical protein